jgi:tRNA G26 N,N-dimethylase Trm1
MTFRNSKELKNIIQERMEEKRNERIEEQFQIFQQSIDNMFLNEVDSTVISKYFISYDEIEPQVFEALEEAGWSCSNTDQGTKISIM